MSPEGSAAGRVAGRYELLERLGRGGMGTVWRARDRLLERDVAVKQVELPPWLPDEEQESVRARVLREARAAARLSHRASVTVFDVVEEGRNTYIVMELVDAVTLAELVEDQGPLSPERAARIGLEVLAALELAHAQGIVHRDVKPGNIMVFADGSAKVTDFGVASVRDHPAITQTGQLVGSPAYMSPEQAQGEASGPPADLWGLGATLYYAVEGRPPFDKAGAIPILNAVVNEEPRSTERAGPLSDVLRLLLSKDPSARPSGAVLRRQLEAVATGQKGKTPTAVEAAPALDAGDGRAVEATAPVPVTPVPPTPVAEAQSEPAPVPPLPGPGPARAPSRAAGRSPVAARGNPSLVMAAVLAVVALLLGLVAWQALDDPSDVPSTAGTPTETPESDRAEEVPADWVRYTDATTGYQIAYPPGWRVQRLDRSRTDFEDPDTGAYLRVDWTDEPGDSPVDDWERQSRSFASRHRNYREYRIEPTTYRDYEAAIWEYGYSSGSARLHAVDLGFVAGRYGFALNFQTPEEAWEESQPTFETFKAAFQPPD